MGLTAATKRADAAQSRRHTSRSLVTAMKAYNDKISTDSQGVLESNFKAWQSFEEELPTVSRKPRKLLSAIQRLRKGTQALPRSFHRWKPNHMTVRRFHEQFRTKRCATNTVGTFLAFDDPV